MKRQRMAIEPMLDEVITIYRAGIQRCWKYIEASKKKTITIENPNVPGGYDERVIEEIEMSKRSSQMMTLQSEILGKIDDVINNWYTDEIAWFTLHGEDITEDINLLNDNFNPSKAILDELMLRYIDKNYSMYKAIKNYADKREYTIRNIQTTEQRMEFIQSFLDATRPRFLADTSLIQEGNANAKRNSFEITIEQYKAVCLKGIR